MVTGAKAFEGKSQVSLMAAILEHEPRSISSLVPLSPPLLEKTIRKCLAKDSNNRWQAASDLIEALEWVRGGSDVPVTAAPESKRWKAVGISSVTLAVLIAIVAALLFFRKTSEAPLWVSLIPPDNNFSPIPVLALSPDGKHII